MPLHQDVNRFLLEEERLGGSVRFVTSDSRWSARFESLFNTRIDVAHIGFPTLYDAAALTRCAGSGDTLIELTDGSSPNELALALLLPADTASALARRLRRKALEGALTDATEGSLGTSALFSTTRALMAKAAARLCDCPLGSFGPWRVHRVTRANVLDALAVHEPILWCTALRGEGLPPLEATVVMGPRIARAIRARYRMQVVLRSRTIPARGWYIGSLLMSEARAITPARNGLTSPLYLETWGGTECLEARFADGVLRVSGPVPHPTLHAEPLNLTVAEFQLSFLELAALAGGRTTHPLTLDGGAGNVVIRQGHIQEASGTLAWQGDQLAVRVTQYFDVSGC